MRLKFSGGIVISTASTKKMLGNVLLALAAFIWGTSFVAQSESVGLVEPFTFNGSRMVIGSLCILPVALLSSRSPKNSDGPVGHRKPNKAVLIGGIICGAVIFVAANLQQFGIENGTTAGKSGFITALYVVMVPVVSIFLKKKLRKTIWIGIVLAVFGLYLLCVKTGDGSAICIGDVITLFCAMAFTGHILVIDYFSPKVNGVWLSCIQFFVGGVLSVVCMFIFEHPSAQNILSAAIPILYSGVMSSGVAYTLQIVGQKYTDPTVASLIMCMESVFAVLSGWIILGDALGAREIIGCVLMFTAILLAQIPADKLTLKKSKNQLL